LLLLLSVLVLPATGEPPIQLANDIQLLGALFAFLLGLAFGSFLNVVVSRWPNNESIVKPASHCRNCDHVLAWWENIPLLSWILLKGRCRQCQTRISFRYPLIELTIGLTWTVIWIRYGEPLVSGVFGEDFSVFRGCWGNMQTPHNGFAYCFASIIGFALLCWLLITLAALDAEHFWLPDILTLPGTGLGFAFTLLRDWAGSTFTHHFDLFQATLTCFVSVLAAAAIVLIIRLAYWLIRRKEGMGLGDAKLMAMLGAWLGFAGALETFVIAVFSASAAALIWLAILAIRRNSKEWAKLPLPLGTFLCLAALPEIFYPNWLWNWYARTFLP